MTTSHYVGIDVSKDKLDVAVLGDKQAWQVHNTKDGIQELVAQMQEICPELIVVEADRKSTRLNSSHVSESRMPSSA